MKAKDIFSILGSWSNEYLENKKDNVQFRFSNNLPIGCGTVRHNLDNEYQILVGISPLSKSLFARNQTVNDLDFIKIGVTMFHEFEHYEQAVNKGISEEISISDLSKVGNGQYYKDNWHILPHEIDAEYIGVVSMWSKLKDISDIDTLMLKHITIKAESNYMIEMPNNGFQSKEQVESLFEQAYDKSLIAKRELSSRFIRSDDEIAQMITDDNKIIRIEYYPFYYQIQTAKTGQEMDFKMASLVSYIHPELQRLYSDLNFSELEPLSVFGIPMPEIKEEILSRIERQAEDSIFSRHSDNNEQDFAAAVADILISDDSLSQ